MATLPVVLTVGTSAILAARLRAAAWAHKDFHLIETDSEAEAVLMLLDMVPGAVVVNADLRAGCPLAVADYVCFRAPRARVIYEMGIKTGFSDGSLFAHSCNAHAMVTRDMETADLGAMVAHHAGAAPKTASGAPELMCSERMLEIA